MITASRHPNSVSVPDDFPVRRTPARPVAQRQEGFERDFDTSTVFYDVVHLDGSLILSGPPLREFGDLVDEALILLDDRVYEGPRERMDLNRGVRIYLECPEPPRTLTLVGEGYRFETPVTHADTEMFRARKVVYTHQKNNDLGWIADWARFNVVTHGADAVLVYDNASTNYGVEQLQAALAAVPGIEVAVVVSWPFLFGPAGGFWAGDVSVPWDSDFCQIGAMEDAQFAFLSTAAGVISTDVDELIFSRSGASVFDRLAQTRNGYLRFFGTWIETVRHNLEGSTSTAHTDFWLHEPHRSPSTFKWAAVPSRLPRGAKLTAHSIHGMPPQVDDEFTTGHFKGISTNWKFQRTEAVGYDPAIHRVHLLLVAALQRAFPDRFGPEKTGLIFEQAARDSVATQAETLTLQLGAAVRQSLRHPEFVTREWVWRGSTVVIDCSPQALRVGYDIYVSSSRVEFSVVARKAVDHPRLAAAVEQSEIRPSSTRTNGFRLGVWTFTGKTLDLISIGSSIASAIDQVNESVDRVPL